MKKEQRGSPCVALLLRFSSVRLNKWTGDGWIIIVGEAGKTNPRRLLVCALAGNHDEVAQHLMSVVKIMTLDVIIHCLTEEHSFYWCPDLPKCLNSVLLLK